MAPGRKPRDDGDGDGDGDSEMVAESVYLVMARDDDQAAYTVLKVDGAAAAQTVAELPGGEPGMSFVAAHSKHGSWIVAVGGGLRAGTIIFDPSTSATYRGPRLVEPMHKPVLISHGGQVYALSRRPRVVPGMDFEPWFESLSFKEGVPSLDGEALVGWDRLPSPPFFPLSLDPYEFRNPPEIVVSSYAAVGPYILVSPQPELLVGTYAFHVVNKTWEKVHDKNLPFVGHAVPVGGSLFAACPISNKVVTDSASLFYMSIDSSPSTPSAAVSRPSLLLHEFPVITSVPKVGPLFCPLGKGRFCSVRSVSFSGSHGKANLLKEVQVILAAFRTDMQTEIIEAILTACQSQGAEVNNLQLALRVKEQSRTYDLLDSSMLVVAALSMNTENIDVSIQGETAETRGNQSTVILEAPVIRYWGREGRIC